jgi:hypothetical protein
MTCLISQLCKNLSLIFGKGTYCINRYSYQLLQQLQRPWKRKRKNNNSSSLPPRYNHTSLYAQSHNGGSPTLKSGTLGAIHCYYMSHKKLPHIWHLGFFMIWWREREMERRERVLFRNKLKLEECMITQSSFYIFITFNHRLHI